MKLDLRHTTQNANWTYACLLQVNIFIHPRILSVLPLAWTTCGYSCRKNDRFGCAIAASNSHCSFCSPAEYAALAPCTMQLLLLKWLYQPLLAQASPLSFSWKSGISWPGRALHHVTCKDPITMNYPTLVSKWIWHYLASDNLLSLGSHAARSRFQSGTRTVFLTLQESWPWQKHTDVETILNNSTLTTHQGHADLCPAQTLPNLSQGCWQDLCLPTVLSVKFPPAHLCHVFFLILLTTNVLRARLIRGWFFWPGFIVILTLFWLFFYYFTYAWGEQTLISSNCFANSICFEYFGLSSSKQNKGVSFFTF